MTQPILVQLSHSQSPCQRFTLSSAARHYVWQQHIPMFIIEWLMRDGSSYPDQDNAVLFVFDTPSFEKILQQTSTLSMWNLRHYFGMCATVKDKQIIQISRRIPDKIAGQARFFHH